MAGSGVQFGTLGHSHGDGRCTRGGGVQGGQRAIAPTASRGRWVGSGVRAVLRVQAWIQGPSPALAGLQASAVCRSMSCARPAQGMLDGGLLTERAATSQPGGGTQSAQQHQAATAPPATECDARCAGQAQLHPQPGAATQSAQPEPSQHATLLLRRTTGPDGPGWAGVGGRRRTAGAAQRWGQAEDSRGGAAFPH